jgi:hypothetical protein
VFSNNLPVSSLFCKILLLSLPHCLLACIRCPFCYSAFHAPCAILVQCTFCFLSISAAAPPLYFFTHALFHLNNQNHHHFSVPCTYSFCAPCACNVRHASACSHRVNLFHISSAMSDHHSNPSASLVVFPCVQHHWMSC